MILCSYVGGHFRPLAIGRLKKLRKRLVVAEKSINLMHESDTLLRNVQGIIASAKSCFAARLHCCDTPLMMQWFLRLACRRAPEISDQRLLEPAPLDLTKMLGQLRLPPLH